MKRSEIHDYQAGREARIKGVPRDGRKNVDWLRGWDDVQDDYNAEDAKAKGMPIRFSPRSPKC